jgi:hypothetical protein
MFHPALLRKGEAAPNPRKLSARPKIGRPLLKHDGIFKLFGIQSLTGRVFCLEKKEVLHFFLPSLTKKQLDKVGKLN